jgi:cytochrome c oxidase cbb3-type subunit III
MSTEQPSSNVDRILGHGHEADGIEEYDNKLPTWWLGLFYACIVWGIGYAVHYHFVGLRSQAGEHEAELVAAAERWPVKEVVAVAAGGDTSAGKEVFATNCVGCHGPTAQGGIGPNLTDSTWIHGGKLQEIQATISNGVPPKGMLAWGPILGPEKVGQVAAYVHSLGGGQ